MRANLPAPSNQQIPFEVPAKFREYVCELRHREKKFLALFSYIRRIIIWKQQICLPPLELTLALERIFFSLVEIDVDFGHARTPW